MRSWPADNACLRPPTRRGRRSVVVFHSAGSGCRLPGGPLAQSLVWQRFAVNRSGSKGVTAPALWGACTSCAGVPFWDVLPTSTWTPGASCAGFSARPEHPRFSTTDPSDPLVRDRLPAPGQLVPATSAPCRSSTQQRTLRMRGAPHVAVRSALGGGEANLPRPCSRGYRGVATLRARDGLSRSRGDRR
jgi:hypothetical protein